MDRFKLQPHPKNPSSGLYEISAALKPENAFDEKSTLCIDFEIQGNLQSLIFAEPEVDCGRRDELWKATCFEVFVHDGQKAYREFNFAPSGNWACYQFDDYRHGMIRPPLFAPPELAIQKSRNRFLMTIRLSARDFLPPSLTHTVSLGFTSVLKTQTHLEYWALAHHSETPDFHSPETFVIPLHMAPAKRTH